MVLLYSYKNMQFWKGKDKENMLIHIMLLMVITMFFAILLVAALLEINFRKNIYSKMTGNYSALFDYCIFREV